MQTPPLLQPGDTIAIICTAKKVEREYIDRATKLLESWGLNVKLGQNLFERHFQFAGTDEQRAADLQDMLNDSEVKAILCARGGYGTVRIVDKVSFDLFTQNPKWIIGFSDITVLHNHIHTHFGIETLHATVPLNFPEGENENLRTLKKALFDGHLNYSIDAHAMNRKGIAQGEVVGGNLAMIQSLAGTNSDIDTRGKILFLEEISEYAYQVDRMMWNLNKSGKLDQLRGLIVGGFTDIKPGPDPFGYSAYEIIWELVKEYDYPVCFDFPAGHQEQNWTITMGRCSRLEVAEESVNFTQSYG